MNLQFKNAQSDRVIETLNNTNSKMPVIGERLSTIDETGKARAGTVISVVTVVTVEFD